MTSRIVLADDHEVLRRGMRALLAAEPDLTVVGEAADGLEAVRLVEQHKPDLLIIDVGMPGLNGIDAAAQVRQLSPRTRVVIFSMHSGQSHVAQAFRSGASAYVSKAGRSEELIHAVHAVIRGDRYLGQELSYRAVDLYVDSILDTDDAWSSLSAREREVFQLGAEGLSNAQIAERLCISPRTVETYRGNVMRKLGLRGQTELVLFAVRRGLLNIDERV